MLVEMAAADSFAIAFEFVPDTEDRPNDLSRYYQHPTYGDMIPGHYTDDTQRSLANAQLVLDGSNDLYNPLAYIRAYQDTFRRDPRAGYSKRFEAFLRNNLESPSVDMALAINRKGTNGAVMGAAVLGFLPSTEAVMLAAAAQALSTHSYTTIPYAQIVALSAYYSINNIGKFKDLSPWLYRLLHESGKSVADFLGDANFNAVRPDKITMGASSVTRLLLWALPRYDSLSDLIKLSVDIGGDTDSAAAVLVAVASESLEYVDDIPQNLYDDMENGEYGRDYLRDMDRQLRDR